MINCDHFVAAGVWDAESRWRQELLVQADKLCPGGSDALLVIDDTVIPKKRQRISVGVAHAIWLAGQDCRLPEPLVPLSAARGEVLVMLALRLLLFPESWTSKRARLERAEVSWRNIERPGTKREMALIEGRSCHRGRCALRLRGGGCRLWAECAVPPGSSRLAN